MRGGGARAAGDGDPTMGDVSEACVVEIKSGELFVAAAGDGSGRVDATGAAEPE